MEWRGGLIESGFDSRPTTRVVFDVYCREWLFNLFIVTLFTHLLAPCKTIHITLISTYIIVYKTYQARFTYYGHYIHIGNEKVAYLYYHCLQCQFINDCHILTCSGTWRVAQYDSTQTDASVFDCCSIKVTLLWVLCWNVTHPSTAWVYAAVQSQNAVTVDF